MGKYTGSRLVVNDNMSGLAPSRQLYHWFGSCASFMPGCTRDFLDRKIFLDTRFTVGI